MASHLGYANPDAMLREMTSKQVAEWMAYYQLEPWGSHEEDRRAALIASTVANVHRGKRKAYKIDDFMPRRDRVQGWREQKRLFQTLTGAE